MQDGIGSIVDSFAVSTKNDSSKIEINPRVGDWMSRAQAGDRAAYRSLLISVLEFLVARRVLGPDDSIGGEQLLVRVHRARHTYRPDLDFERWLLAVVNFR